MKGKKGKNGAKKYGRNKIKCDRYKAQNRRLKNKARKIRKHLLKHVNDVKSAKYLATII